MLTLGTKTILITLESKWHLVRLVYVALRTPPMPERLLKFRLA